jgi:2,3-bisphosphoglycerate-independent phosphoglycerate mutase
MGNSEVGHLTIGAGRVNYQDLERINFAIADGTFAKNKVLLDLFNSAKAGTGRLHLMGLVSNGAVHSHIEHLKVILTLAKANGVPDAMVHCFADGRDTAPRSAKMYVQELVDFMAELGYGRVASVTGRYYAMDRDRRWARVQKAYDAIVEGKGAEVVSDYAGLFAAIDDRYARDQTDEFIEPIVVQPAAPAHPQADLVAKASGANVSVSSLLDGDAVLFFNFRADRMREISQCIAAGHCPFETVSAEGVSDTVRRTGLSCAQFTRYDSKLSLPTVFPPCDTRDGISECLSKHGLLQFHTAETEKYAHVTFFFNGGVEEAFKGEERGLVPSPAVATYDLQPAMNAKGVGESVSAALALGRYDFVLCNFAPPDMVGHTGVLPAAIEAIAATDAAIGVIAAACAEHGYTLAVTADHGNAEQMLNAETGAPHTAHTSNAVPMYMVAGAGVDAGISLKSGGGLSDIAPTLLDLMGVPQPEAMTGKSLVVKPQ